MDNGMDSLLDTYLFETNTLLSSLDELLLDAEETREFSEDQVNEIFRAMHTIKGSSAMLQFNSLMEISHHIEDLFFYIRENGMDKLTDEHKSDLFDLMFSSVDKLREEIEKVEANEALDDNIDSFVDAINNFLAKISGKGEAAAEEAAPADAEAGEEAKTESAGGDDTASFSQIKEPLVVQVFFDAGAGMENLRSFMLVNSLKDVDFKFSFYPADVETNSETSEWIQDNGFLLGFESEEEVSKAESTIASSGGVSSYEIHHNAGGEEEAKQASEPAAEAAAAPAPAEAGAPAPAEAAAPAPEAAPAKEAAPAPKKKAEKKADKPSAPAKQSLISVNLSKLDALMAIVGEIVITESMVTSSPDLQGIKLDNFQKSARQLRKLTDDLQDVSMSLRMVSVSNVFQKMHRIVRDMSKSLNKDVKLTVIGENTEVDKTIVDTIGDPIMHIVRNSMDHGIEENVDDRIARGKPMQGEIILSAEHTGSEVIISVKDDGAGMDPDAILAKAERQGILTKPAEEYTKKEALNLLMMPGFSTNAEVTEYSGRGVGMDVVKKNVEQVGGTVSITSEVGEGSCVTLKIPLTLAIADGMELSVGGANFTIPISNIRQSFKAKEEDIILDSAGNEMIKCLDGFYPIVRIGNLYNMETNSTCLDDGILIWVEAGDKSYCLFVDELIGEQQVVVKPLPGYLDNFHIKEAGITGCTILGSGDISLILDVANVYNASQSSLY